MSSKKLPIALALVATSLAGCGAVNVHPTASSSSTSLTSRGRVDSPLTDVHDHLDCLRDAHLAVHEVGPTQLRIGALPTGASVVFTPTAGAAQAEQIDGSAQGAEVIGSALLYPNQASEDELMKIEDCLAQGVQG